jgi:FO synthase
VFEETGLLPHLNPGVMERADLAMLRPVSASMGIMLESSCRTAAGMKGGPHHRSPDEHPVGTARNRCDLAGELASPVHHRAS